MNCGGAFVQVRKKSQPPISTGPSCGWSNGYQSTKPVAAERVVVPAQQA